MLCMKSIPQPGLAYCKKTLQLNNVFSWPALPTSQDFKTTYMTPLRQPIDWSISSFPEEGLQQPKDFVMRHDAQIPRFSPTHAVIHLGGNDVMNREQKLPLGNFGQAIKNLKALGAWLVAQYNVEVHYSKFLPHARYPCPQGQKLPDWMFERNKFWLNYNRMVAQARNNHYNNIVSIIFHPQIWDGIKNATLEFHETEHFRK